MFLSGRGGEMREGFFRLAVWVTSGLVFPSWAFSGAGHPFPPPRPDLKGDPCLEVEGLSFAPGTKDTLTWQPASCADAYGLVRGWISNRGFDPGFDRCLFTEIPDLLAVDRVAPDPGEAFTYSVAGLNVNEETKEVRYGSAACGVRLYIDPSATGDATGRSWKDAFPTIQAAIDCPWEPNDKEFWVKGPIHESVTVSGFATVQFLGGFLGTETRAWERQIESSPTRWEGNAGEILLDAAPSNQSVRLVVDGFTMRGGSTAIINGNESMSGLAEIRNTRFEALTGVGIQLADHYCTLDDRWVLIRDCSFDSSLTVAVRYWSDEDATIRGRITRNRFEGAQEAIIDLTLREYRAHALLSLDILANEFHGGRNAIRLEASGLEDGTADILSTIGSNFIVEAREDAIALLTSCQYAGKLEVSNRPIVIGNTITSAAGSGLSCAVAAKDTGPETRAECRPQLWDNLITGCREYGVREGPDDPPHNAYSDPVLIGNDIFANGAMYLDEGTTVLRTPRMVNALPGFRDNDYFNPQYIDPFGGDFHLSRYSPARDRGHREAPGWPAIDAEGQCRLQGSAPDLGAFELPGRGSPP